MTLLTEFKESVIIAWAALRANKLRAGLTTLGIVIGIVSVTLMGTAITGLNAAFKKSMGGISADTLFIQRFSWLTGETEWRLSRNRKELTLQNARDVERLATLSAAVSVESQGNGNVSVGRKQARGAWVEGNDENSLMVRGLAVTSGRWLSAGDVQSGRPVWVLGSYLAERFFPNGNAIGSKVKLNDMNLEVIGVMEKQGSFFTGFNLDNQIVIPITRFTRDFTRWPDLTIQVKVRDLAQLEDAKEEVRGIMRKLRRVPPDMQDDFAINQQDALINFFNAVGGTIATVGLFISGLSLFVGGIGIMNIMFVSVAERTKEIGIRKAIGAKRRTILVQFLVEAATITLGAGILGLLVAWPLTLVVDKFLAASMPWWLVAVALIVSVLTGVVSGFLPAWRAARMDPVDALRAD
ncbi:MAG TPA: ABC transporter permease [Candidatus Limnocylindria bacterium]|nr:ABC transporter permease [Candidatus Limnocylindria bacterium]